MWRGVRTAVALSAAAVAMMSGAAVAVAEPEPPEQLWSIALRVPLCRFEFSEHGMVARVEFRLEGEHLRHGSTVAGRGVLKLDDEPIGRQFDMIEMQAADDGTASTAQVIVAAMPELLPGSVVVELALAGHDAAGDVFVFDVEERAACSRGVEPLPDGQ